MQLLTTSYALSRQFGALLSQKLVIAAIFLLAFSTQGSAQVVYALAGNNLISMNLASPSSLVTVGTVTGIAAGQTIEGIDFRPNTGQLYAIGYNQTTGEARLYTINVSSAVASAIGVGPINLQPNMGEVNFDFNPTVDRIRVTGSNTANYRLHPVTGAIAATDGNLAYALADVNAAAIPFIAAAAYTNSYIGATATTLFNYDAALNVLTNQNPPNNGTCNTIGTAGITVALPNPMVDMDIFFDAATQTNTAVMVAATGVLQETNVYAISLATGAATALSPIGLPLQIDDIAVQIEQNIPAQVTGQLVYALTANNSLISFDSELPGVVRSITSTSGVFAAQPLAGLDFRPATGELYAIGYNNASGMARLYTLNLSTGAATAIGTDSVMLMPGMGTITFDFNPTVDRIRVMGSNGSNFRMHPLTGAVAATDGNLSYAVGDVNAGASASIGAGAYTNSFNGSTATTLLDYDYGLNVVASQIPPNNGTLNTIGASGITVNAASPTIDMDIFYEYADGSNTAYLSANTGATMNDGFYEVNLTTGAATLIGNIGLGIAVKNIAVFLDTPPPPSTTFVAHLSGHNQAFPVATAGSGEITATLTGDQLVVTGNYAGMTGLIDLNIAGGAHVHAGYAGQNGGIEIELVPTPDASLTGGSFSAGLNTFTLTQAQIDLLNNRQLYINIHTDLFPAGEIRGQLLPEADGYFTSNLFGSNEVPAFFSNSHGALVLELHADTLVVSGAFDDLDGKFNAAIAGGAHLHLGLAGQTGGIALELNADVDNDLYGGHFSAAENTFVLTADQIAALQAHQLYANIHTALSNSGELRGQVLGNADAVFRAHLSGANEYPFVTSLAGGQLVAELRGNELRVSGSFSGLESNATAAHIHVGMAGQNGGVAFGLTYELEADQRSGTFQATANSFTLADDQVQLLLGRGFYVNIHSAMNASGEIRGQLLLESQAFLTAYLTGSQSVPDVSSGGHGVVTAEISGSRLILSGSFSELASGVDIGSHLHAGFPGLAGSVLLPLFASLDGGLTSGVYSPNLNQYEITTDVKEMLLARETYINVHTLGMPDGEIRGNLLAEAAAYFLSPLGGASQTPSENVPASGMMILEVSGNQAIAVGSFSALGTDFDPNFLGGAHFHGAYAGSNGDILAELEASFDVDYMNGVFEAQYNGFTMTDGFLDSLRNRQVYTNIHTLGVQAGEVRGQLMPLSASYFHTSLAGVNEESPMISNGIGGMKFELNGNVLTATGSFRDLDGQFDPNVAGGSHIHIGEPGNSGNIVLELDATLDAGNQGGLYPADNNNFTLTTDQIASLRNGEYYVNIHTSAAPSGEIRGQILPEINYFPTVADLTSPLPGASINIEGLPTELLTLNWTPATDPDGDNVVYVWQVSTTPDFSNIVYMQGAGEDLLTTVTYGELDAVLADNGVAVGGNVTLYHRIVVTDGSNATPGEAQDAQFTRGVVSGTGEVLANLFNVQVMPNITRDNEVLVRVSSQTVAEAQLQLMDTSGKLLQSRSVELSNGTQDFNLPFGFPAGTYYLSVQTEMGTLPAQRILKID